MKLWLISQDANNGYDTFDSAVVVAETEEAARKIHPSDTWEEKEREYGCSRTWTTELHRVKVQYLGNATDGLPLVVCASFNAG